MLSTLPRTLVLSGSLPLLLLLLLCVLLPAAAAYDVTGLLVPEPSREVNIGTPIFMLSGKHVQVSLFEEIATFSLGNMCVKGQYISWNETLKADKIDWPVSPTAWYPDILSGDFRDGQPVDVSLPWPCIERGSTYTVLFFCVECSTLHGVLSLQESVQTLVSDMVSSINKATGKDTSVVFVPDDWISPDFVEKAIAQAGADHVIFSSYSETVHAVMEAMPDYNFTVFYTNTAQPMEMKNAEVLIFPVHKMGFEAGVLASYASKKGSVCTIVEDLLVEAVSGISAGVRHVSPNWKVANTIFGTSEFDTSDKVGLNHAVATLRNCDVVISVDRHSSGPLAKILETNDFDNMRVISVFRTVWPQRDGTNDNIIADSDSSFPFIVNSVIVSGQEFTKGIVSNARGQFLHGVRYLNYEWTDNSPYDIGSVERSEFLFTKRKLRYGSLQPLYDPLEVARADSTSPYVDVGPTSVGNAEDIEPSWQENPIVCDFDGRAVLFDGGLTKAFTYMAAVNERTQLDGLVVQSADIEGASGSDDEEDDYDTNPTAVVWRQNASCTSVSGSTVIIHGGVTSNSRVLNETIIATFRRRGRYGWHTCQYCTTPLVMRLPRDAKYDFHSVPPRHNHGAFINKNGELQVVNGYGPGEISQTKTHALNLKTFTWSVIPGEVVLFPEAAEASPIGVVAFSPVFIIYYDASTPLAFDSVTKRTYDLKQLSSGTWQWSASSPEVPNMACITVMRGFLTAVTSSPEGEMYMMRYRRRSNAFTFMADHTVTIIPSSMPASMEPRVCVGLPHYKQGNGGALIIPSESNTTRELSLIDVPSRQLDCGPSQFIAWDFASCTYCSPGHVLASDGFCEEKVDDNGTMLSLVVPIVLSVTVVGIMLLIVTYCYCFRSNMWSRACDVANAPGSGESPIAAVRICPLYLQEHNMMDVDDVLAAPASTGMKKFKHAVDVFSNEVCEVVKTHKCFLIRFTGDMAMFVAKDSCNVLMAVSDLSQRLLDDSALGDAMGIQCGLHYAHVNRNPTTTASSNQARFVYSGMLAEECAKLMMASRVGVFVASASFYARVDQQLLNSLHITPGDTYDLHITNTQSNASPGGETRTRVRDLIMEDLMDEVPYQSSRAAAAIRRSEQMLKQKTMLRTSYETNPLKAGHCGIVVAAVADSDAATTSGSPPTSYNNETQHSSTAAAAVVSDDSSGRALCSMSGGDNNNCGASAGTDSRGTAGGSTCRTCIKVPPTRGDAFLFSIAGSTTQIAFPNSSELIAANTGVGYVHRHVSDGTQQQQQQQVPATAPTTATTEFHTHTSDTTTLKSINTPLTLNPLEAATSASLSDATTTPTLPATELPSCCLQAAAGPSRHPIEEEFSQVLLLATSMARTLLARGDGDGKRRVRHILAERFQVPFFSQKQAPQQYAASALSSRLLAIADVYDDVRRLQAEGGSLRAPSPATLLCDDSQSPLNLKEAHNEAGGSSSAAAAMTPAAVDAVASASIRSAADAAREWQQRVFLAPPCGYVDDEGEEDDDAEEDMCSDDDVDHQEDDEQVTFVPILNSPRSPPMQPPPRALPPLNSNNNSGVATDVSGNIVAGDEGRDGPRMHKPAKLPPLNLNL